MTLTNPAQPIDANVMHYGAIGNGVTDDTSAIQATINALPNGGAVFFPAGSYVVSSPITLNKSKIRLVGTGVGSRLLLSASFRGAQVISITADFCGVESLWIQFANATTSLNPVADCIKISPSYNFLLRDLFIENINGWAIEVIEPPATYTANSWSTLDNVTIKKCKQGIHMQGSDDTNVVQSVSLSNINITQILNGDGIFLEDCNSIKCVNVESGLDTGAGSALHIKGASSVIEMVNGTLGCTTPTSTGPCVLIEAGAHGTPKTINLTNCDLEQGLYGVQITACSESNLTDCTFMRNASHHINMSGGGTDGIRIHGCSFNNDGVYGRIGTPRYDINSSAGGQNFITNCLFLEGIGTGASQVDQHINITGGTHQVSHCNFKNGSAFHGLAQEIRDNFGYNPVGPLTAPSLPASGTPYTNPFSVDCTVFVTGGSVTAVAIEGTNTGLTSGTFRVPANRSIKLTYTVAPSWAWFGD